MVPLTGSLSKLLPEAHIGPFQTSMMAHFAKIDNSFQALTIFSKKLLHFLNWTNGTKSGNALHGKGIAITITGSILLL